MTAAPIRICVDPQTYKAQPYNSEMVEYVRADHFEKLKLDRVRLIGELLKAAEGLDGYVNNGYGDQYREFVAEMIAEPVND